MPTPDQTPGTGPAPRALNPNAPRADTGALPEPNRPQRAPPGSLHPSTFGYLKPSEEQERVMGLLRVAAATYADMLDAYLPGGPDKTFILRQFREVVMWVNTAVTRHADGAPR